MLPFEEGESRVGRHDSEKQGNGEKDWDGFGFGRASQWVLGRA